MKKRWPIAAVLVVAGVVGGGLYLKQLAYQKIGNEVIQVVQSPAVQDQINKAMQSQSVQSKLNQVEATLSQQKTKLAVPKVQESGQQGTNQSSTAQDNSANSSNVMSTNSDHTVVSDSANSGSNVSSGGSSASESSTSGGSASNATSSAPALANRQDAINYAMSKFSPQEIAALTAEYANRKNLSQQQKDQIKAEVLSRFSPQELAALMAASKK